MTGPQISSIKVKVPDKDEQTKIGAFFKILDQLITVNERELLNDCILCKIETGQTPNFILEVSR
ncbi:hypothetical protein LKI_02830 [Leuconostoc kimchii IMSNU 11154]|uniref:Uncharacterized protein n=1 Tax=Leuconostoc kimchii (strain IMSNU 11154 / KCTC 2386 / IH25) TaxID=762051 RepID=D5T1G0_LEUKI|nr:hypothetical protein LKI_02830 [Leuconostoc kimchii IMSNU 11154]